MVYIYLPKGKNGEFGGYAFTVSLEFWFAVQVWLPGRMAPTPRHRQPTVGCCANSGSLGQNTSSDRKGWRYRTQRLSEFQTEKNHIHLFVLSQYELSWRLLPAIAVTGCRVTIADNWSPALFAVLMTNIHWRCNCNVRKVFICNKLKWIVLRSLSITPGYLSRIQPVGPVYTSMAGRSRVWTKQVANISITNDDWLRFELLPAEVCLENSSKYMNFCVCIPVIIPIPKTKHASTRHCSPVSQWFLSTWPAIDVWEPNSTVSSSRLPESVMQNKVSQDPIQLAFPHFSSSAGNSNLITSNWSLTWICFWLKHLFTSHLTQI